MFDIVLTYNNTQIHFYPEAISSISTIVRNSPVPNLGSSFEMNSLNYIRNDDDLQCFLLMCRNASSPLVTDISLCSAVQSRCQAPNPYIYNPDEWKTLAEKGFNCLNFYAASRLCDFLDIEAQSILCYHKDCNALRSKSHILTKVIYHQTAMQSNNKCALAEIMILMRNTHQATVRTSYENEYNTNSALYRTNAESLARTFVYHACSLITLQWKTTDLASKYPEEYECLFHNLHWEALNECYGITVGFADHFDI